MVTEVNPAGANTYSAIGLKTAQAGERQEGSIAGADHTAVAGEWAIASVAYNGSAEARTIWNGPCLIAGYRVTTSLSAHASGLEDGGTSRYPFTASEAAAFAPVTFPGPIIFLTNCIWNPGSLSAGNILVWYRPLDVSVTWAY